MKLSRKNVGRIATTFLATAMLASLTAVPAMAVDNPIGSGDDNMGIVDSETDIDSFTMKKNLRKPEKVYAPNLTFEFKVEAVYPNNNETVEGTRAGEDGATETVSIKVDKGVEGGIVGAESTEPNNTFGQATFSPQGDYIPNDGKGDDGGIGSKLISEDVTFQVNNEVFTHAGVYKYTITETQFDPAEAAYDEFEDIKFDTVSTRVLYVYVEENDNSAAEADPYIVTGIVMKNGDKKDDGFDNGYFKDPDGNNETPHELFVQKEVTGAMGNKSEEFAFTIKIDGAEGEKYYAVVEEWQTVEGVEQWVSLENQGKNYVIESGAPEITFTLKHNQRLHVYGLSDTDTYTVVEKTATGYVTTVNGYIVETGEDGKLTPNDNGDGYENTKLTNSSEVANTFEGTLGHTQANNDPEIKDVTVLYENNREAVSPTGIVMNVAPYALLVVIAAAGCFVFLRKRDED